ncbi:MAG: M20/M25/M40 family metallo-hydrolase [Desulfobacterales bacterium]|nr:M20/M25/M40 family metallo-hydrolase [Desulfobacterales bacterium]
MINKDRLSQTFTDLVRIDSISKDEAAIAENISKIFSEMGAEILVDNSSEKTGSNTGNLVIKLAGNLDIPPLLLSAHMDTVGPGKGVNPIFKNGVFTSDGTTILGADDKSAIANIIEAVRVIQENGIQYGPIEVVITVCEEIGLIGAKYLDFGLIESKYGYVLDTMDTEGIVTRAPGANSLEFTVYGKDAHAGIEPEKGINAIQVAGSAIAKLDFLGRIDHETTCNIGFINGGIATNIVPSLVTVEGEVRSHDETKLMKVTDRIKDAFSETVQNFRKQYDDDLPELDINIYKDFSATNIPEDHPVISIAKEAAKRLGRELATKTTGGGADANVFFEHGIFTGVLGTGMTDVHTLRESITLDDLVKTTELLIEIIKCNSNNRAAES